MKIIFWVLQDTIFYENDNDFLCRYSLYSHGSLKVRAFLGKLMFSNILQRKIPSFEKISVNIFLMRKYAQKNVLDPVLFICYYWKLSNETAHKCAQISNLQFLYPKPPENGKNMHFEAKKRQFRPI